MSNLQRAIAILTVLSFLASCQQGDGGSGAQAPEKGPHGWPKDSDGTESPPYFADIMFLECWVKQGRTIGVKGSWSLGRCLFRWDCETLSSYIADLKDLIEGKWGKNSIPKFDKGSPSGQTIHPQPEYPDDFDQGEPMNPLDVGVVRDPRPKEDVRPSGTIKIRLENCGWAYLIDEESANYFHKWLSDAWRQCCL